MESGDLSLEKLAGLAKMMNMLNSSKNEVKKSQRTGRVTEFDAQFEVPAIKTIKAAIPYIDRRYRRELGVMVKLIEIDKFLREYKNVEVMDEGRERGNLAMLEAVVPNLPTESRATGEMLVKLLEIKEIAERSDSL